jgi:hypothetical protein
MNNKIVGIYSIFLGLSVIAFWCMIFIMGSISGGKTELFFRLMAEFLMAIICVVSGILLLKNSQKAYKLNIAGLAMLVYSSINSVGYFANRSLITLVLMFLLLLAISVVLLFNQLFKEAKRPI